jgi:hypothetical protein
MIIHSNDSESTLWSTAQISELQNLFCLIPHCGLSARIQLQIKWSWANKKLSSTLSRIRIRKSWSLFDENIRGWRSRHGVSLAPIDNGTFRKILQHFNSLIQNFQTCLSALCSPSFKTEIFSSYREIIHIIQRAKSTKITYADVFNVIFPYPPPLTQLNFKCTAPRGLNMWVDYPDVGVVSVV